MKKNSNSIDSNRILTVLLFVIAFVIILVQSVPYIIATSYTFPLQDDFYNTGVVLKEIESSGGNSFSTSLRLAYEGFFNYRGYYFSTFITYFADAVTKCSITQIRVWQTIMLIAHYAALVFMLYYVGRKIMKLNEVSSVLITMAVFSLIPSQFYFVNNETLFWFCASTIYQLPATLLYIFVVLFIYGIEKDSRLCCVICFILGFLLGGASVNVAVLVCIITCQLIYWGIVVCKKIFASCISGIPALIGSSLNVLAPGNYKNGAAHEDAFDRLIVTFKGSFLYEFDRLRMFAKENPLFICIILVILIVFIISERHFKYRFPIPGVYTVLLILGEVGVIFPLQWVSDRETYAVYERCIIVSDWASFLILMLIVFYWTGWIKCRLKYTGLKNSNLRLLVNYLAMMVIAIVLVAGREKTASGRLTGELYRGDLQSYCNWVAGIIKDVEQSDESVVRIYTKEVADTTCMANAFFNMGEYDPSVYTGNSAMSIFYGKEAVYLIDEGE